MELIDAQIHGVDPVKPRDDVTDSQALLNSADLAVSAMDAVGVASAVINWRLPYVLTYLERYPDRFAGLPFVGWPELEPPDRVDEVMAELAAVTGIIGVRIVVGIPDDGARGRLLRDRAFDAYFAAAERHRLPVFLLAHGFLPDVHPTIRAHPGHTFVIDHVGLQTPPRAFSAGPELFEQLPDVLDLAQYPNVAVKFTGVPSLSTQPYPFEDVWPPMHRLLDAFGVERLMWGSDFTRCRSLHTYREAVDFLLLTDEVSASDKAMLFAGSIRRWLDWPVPEPEAQAAESSNVSASVSSAS